MKLVFIYGLPATGKLTVAQELATLTKYKLFHNHLVVDLLLSTFDFGSASFVTLREEIWLSVFQHACRSGIKGMVFTFAPESTVSADFIPKTVDVVARCGGEIDFVELLSPLEVLKRRMGSPSRMQHGKLTSIDLFEQLLADGNLDALHMPRAKFTIDTNVCLPAEAALRIAHALELV